MIDSKLISVIVPIHKVEPYLCECLDSIVGQSYSNLQIILVDDGSPDNCGTICDEYALKDPRIIVIHKANGGLVSARKRGLQHAKGRYVVYVDGDDWIERDALEILLIEAERTEADIVAAGHQDDFGERVEHIYNNIPQGVYDREGLESSVFPFMLCTGKFSQFGITSYVWSKLFKRELLLKTQPLVDNRIVIGEDAAVTYPALLLAQRVSVLEITKYHYRQHSASMVKNLNSAQAERQGLNSLYSHLLKALEVHPEYFKLKRQLDAYILSLATVRCEAFIDRADTKFLFPFAKVKRGSHIVLVGAGTFGKHLYNRIKTSADYTLIGWIDPYQSIGLNEEFSQIRGTDFDYAVIAYIDETITARWEYELTMLGIPPNKIARVEFDFDDCGQILEKLGITSNCEKREDTMLEHSGKKLLILGANHETAVLVETAKAMGSYTIVTDYNPDAPAKKIADKACNVDGFDVDGLVALAREKEVDGILVGVADPLIDKYQKVCDALNLPCYATAEQIETFTNKYNFKRRCEKFGIDGVPEYDIESYLSNGDYSGIEFPVIIKPADSNSGNGISLCNSPEELPDAVKKALGYSRSHKILCERYMGDCDDISVYYTFKDGEYYLSSISDRYTSREQGLLSPVCLGDVFPSRHADAFIKNYHPKFCEMFKSLGCQNGILYVSAFYKDGHVYVYDPGFRLQGGGFHLLVNAVSGFDHRKMLINFALTGSMGDEDLHVVNDPMFGGKAAAVIWFLLKEGAIGEIEGMDFAASHTATVHIVQRFNIGDAVEADFIGTEKQVFARIYVICETKEQLKETVTEMAKRVKVYDRRGKSMLLNAIDPDKVQQTLLKGKTIVISGGANGVGRSLAIECARQGANVVIGDKDEANGQKTADEILAFGGKSEFSYTELRDVTLIKRLFEVAVKNFGRVDGLVNYAGITPLASLTDCIEGTYDDVMDINLKAAFFCSQQAVREMRKTGGGSIIFVASAHAQSGHKDRAPYAVSKGALVTLSEHIAHNYAKEHIRSNVITLGWTPTEGELSLRAEQGITEEELRKSASDSIPMGRMLEKDDPIPAFIYYLSDLSAMVTGSNIRVTGGEYIC